MEHREYRLAAIMCTEIVGFNRLMAKDETSTLKLLAFHNEFIRQHVAACGGKIIKINGDAFLSEFSNANNAVKCAVALQTDLELHNSDREALQLVLRIGVNLGDIHFFENDAVGEGITIANYLRTSCKPGRICISSPVYSLVSRKIEVSVRPLGTLTGSNDGQTVTAWEILTNGAVDTIDPEMAAQKAREPSESGIKADNFSEFVDQLKNRFVRQKAGFRSHLALYVVINGACWVAWVVATSHGFPWPLVVSLAWGIGLASHVTQFMHRSRNIMQCKSLPALDQRQLGLLRKLFKERRNWDTRLVSNTATSIFLAVLNAIISPFLPWALFPIVGMAIGLFARWPTFKSREHDILSQLSRDRISIDIPSTRR